MFKIGQGAAIAQAVVKGYSSAVSAWEAGMSTGGPWAPAVAAAYTAASLAKTATLISSIKSASPSGGAGVSVSGGGSVSTGTTFNGGAPPQAQQEQRQPTSTVLEIRADSRRTRFSREEVEDIFKQANELSADGDVSIREFKFS